MLNSAKGKLKLPSPIFDSSATRIIGSSSYASSSKTDALWTELEDQALQTWDRKGKRPMRLLPDPKTVSAGIDGT